MDIHDGERDDAKGASFWKKNNKAVPGRPSPRKEDKMISSYVPSSSTSFQDFQQSINDAWDLGDDEFCNISNIKVSKRPPQLAGDNVINIHKHMNRGEIMKNCSMHNSCKVNSYPPWMACEKEGVGRPVSKILDSSGDLLKNKAIEIKNNPGRNGSGNDAYRNRVKKFQTLLSSPQINLSDLKNLSWPGIPFPLKAETWRILAGYASTRSDIREENLKKKRAEYWFYVKEHYETDARDNTYQGTYRQIHIDIPRMSPNILLFRQKAVQTMFERILFIWSVKNPASGYVQGINDLVTPFFIVFLHNVLESDLDLDAVNVEQIPKEKRDIVEADSFWCFCKFLGGIQDNYIFPQLGIQSKISDLRDIINRIDGPLHKHLQDNGVEYLQFSFRWMNNLLTRELPLRCLIRLWDTYLAELDSFASFQLYVCAAFLLHWKQDLMLQKDFQGLMLTLQNLPTQNWNDSDIDLLVAEAHRLKSTYEGARNHFQSKNS